jgi:hypothetical protein
MVEMTTEQKIEAIKEAIEKAKNHQSKMDQVAWDVPALSSLKIRHLMNNLGGISTRYFECGVHKGGLFCSTIRNNPNLLSASANDSFESDETNEDKAFPQFTANVEKCKSESTIFTLAIGDTFEVGMPLVDGPIDLYLFDSDHSYSSQCKAVTYYLPAMSNIFIMCIDDFDWQDVSRGTYDGIKESGCEILFEEIWEGNDHDNSGAWNGYGIFLLKK